MERKDFIRKMATGGSILFTAPILFNACSSSGEDDPGDPGGVIVDLSDSAFSALGTVGGFAYKGDIIIFRTGENTYVALSKICTHQSCTVTYNHDNGTVPCPCHGSVYTTAGVVTAGPAPANLKRYTVQKSGNILTIS